MWYRFSLAASMLLILVGCDMPPAEDGLTYTGPKNQPETGAVVASQQSVAEAVATVSSRLRAAGLRNVSANSRTGTVSARNVGPGLVDCGTFTQSARGNVSRFFAHAAQAAIFNSIDPGQLQLREVAVSSDVTVQISSGPPFLASTQTWHTVRVSQKPVANPGQGWRQERRFEKGNSATFPDQVICVDNGRLGAILAGR